MNQMGRIGGQGAELYSEVLPGLFQGGTDDGGTVNFAQPLRYTDSDDGFDAIVTLYAWAAPATWGVEERRFGFPDANLNVSLLPRIHALAEWAHDEWKAGRRVLIRCQAGLNRSGLIMALVLMRAGFDADSAIELIRERRSEYALFNRCFVDYLRSSQPYEFIIVKSPSDSITSGG
jgi:hypothetical protein